MLKTPCVIALAMGVMTNASSVSVMARQQSPQRQASSSVFAPVAGTSEGSGTFTGTLAIQRFESRSNVLVAIGTISGVLSQGRDAARTLVTQVAVPVDMAPGGVRQATGAAAEPNTCEAVHLELESSTLNVLGSSLALDPVSLDIASPQPGPPQTTQPPPSAGAPQPVPPAPSPAPTEPGAPDQETVSSGNGPVIVGGTTSSGGQAAAPASTPRSAGSVPSTGSLRPGVAAPVRSAAAAPQPQLGELLCAVARVQPAGREAQVAQLLNQILAVLS